MRLSKAALQPTSNILVDLDTDFLSDKDAAEALEQRKASSQETSTSERTQLRSPSDICNISGMLTVPSSFGSLFLGEVLSCHFFASYLPTLVFIARIYLI